MASQTKYVGSGASDSSSGGSIAWTNPGNITASDGSNAIANGLTGIPTDKHIYLIKGGVIGGTDQSAGASWVSGETTANFGGATDLWGVTLLPSDVNASNFGCALAAGGSTYTYYLDGTMGSSGFTLPSNSIVNGLQAAWTRNYFFCFADDTRIGTLGDDKGKRVQDVKVGDKAWGAQEDLLAALNTVEHVEVSENWLWEVETDYRQVCTTASHPFCVIRGGRLRKIPVRQLRPGLDFAFVWIRGKLQVERIRRVIRTKKWRPVFQLGMDGSHTYFANGFLVHNKNTYGALVDSCQMTVYYTVVPGWADMQGNTDSPPLSGGML